MAAGDNHDDIHGDDGGRMWGTLQTYADRITHVDAYTELLASCELPVVVVECLERLRARPDPERLQQVIAMLLHMVEFPKQASGGMGHPARRQRADPSSSPADMVEYAREWAIDTLLDLEIRDDGSTNAKTDPIEVVGEKLPLQQLQTSLCTFAAHTGAHLVEEMQESIFSAFALQQVHLDDEAFADVLDLCATTMVDDLEFALFVDAILASRASFLLSSSRFLERLFAADASSTVAASEAASQAATTAVGSTVTQRAARSFDQLSFPSMVRVWANHLPSWENQLQEWMLHAHRAPYVSIASIVWRCSDGQLPEDAAAILQSYSYLYAVMIKWFMQHSSFLVSPRSGELLRVLSQYTRHSTDHRAFERRLVHELVGSTANAEALWTPPTRAHALLKVPSALRDLLLARPSTTDEASSMEAMQNHLHYEWIGLAERPHMLQEALEMLFVSPTERSVLLETYRLSAAETEAARHGAAALLGWFYSFSSPAGSAQAITDATLKLASSLDLVDLPMGSAWLQQTRSEFQALTFFRIKIVWFWLLKGCYTAADSIQNDAAVVDALESIEYAFRRFSPTTKHKRSFQVEVVTQLLIDLEWRWLVVVRQRGNASPSRHQELQERMDVLLAWLKKIVQLMQIEHHRPHATSKATTTTTTSNSNDLEQLAKRLECIFNNV